MWTRKVHPRQYVNDSYTRSCIVDRSTAASALDAEAATRWQYRRTARSSASGPSPAMRRWAASRLVIQADRSSGTASPDSSRPTDVVAFGVFVSTSPTSPTRTDSWIAMSTTNSAGVEGCGGRSSMRGNVPRQYSRARCTRVAATPTPNPPRGTITRSPVTFG